MFPVLQSSCRIDGEVRDPGRDLARHAQNPAAIRRSPQLVELIARRDKVQPMGMQRNTTATGMQLRVRRTVHCELRCFSVGLLPSSVVCGVVCALDASSVTALTSPWQDTSFLRSSIGFCNRSNGWFCAYREGREDGQHSQQIRASGPVVHRDRRCNGDRIRHLQRHL